MSVLKIIYTLIIVLPDILKLIENIEKKNKDTQIDRKVKEDVKAINQAFKDKDEKALRDIFNS